MIDQQEYQQRRERLMSQLPEGSIVFITSAPEFIRSGDTHFKYRQNSDFYYLTGFNEPEAVLVLAPNREEGEFILFNRANDPAVEAWTGPRAGQGGACQDFGADESFNSQLFEEYLPELLENRSQVFFPIGRDGLFDEMIMTAVNLLREQVRKGISAPENFSNIEPILHEMRLIKSDAEIKLMEKAAQISVKAHKAAMVASFAGIYEYQLEAELMKEFFAGGSRYPAYNPIVGGGANACVLHYDANNMQVADGDLVLIDAGAELDCYASDITRTFPVNGKFTEDQKALYDVVLKAQLAGIDKARAGVLWSDIQKTIIEVMTQGLIDLKILQGSLNTLIEQQAYIDFYWHNSGHWLGLDTHDVGRYKVNNQWRELQAGMVLTVEPGIYIAAGNEDVDEKWWNMGIRIEDDVLVTEGEPKILSHSLAKTTEEIEALMAK